jgi:hypothetical protein
VPEGRRGVRTIEGGAGAENVYHLVDRVSRAHEEAGVIEVKTHGAVVAEGGEVGAERGGKGGYISGLTAL